jgi:pyruvate/2-oxoglutarate dehydrogenase complex dihydrolipoamide dehydrogenase (E3) component
MDAVPRARTRSERNGFMQALVATGDDRIMGFVMLAAQAGDVMAVVQRAVLGNLPLPPCVMVSLPTRHSRRV